MRSSQGTVILLVGPSCAGKSTLAEAIQSASARPFLIQSLDGLFAVTPEAYGGSGRHSREGFHYEWLVPLGGDAAPVRRLAYGAVGWRLLQGFHRAVGAYARAGVDVIVDDMLLDLEGLADWAAALADLEVVLVKVIADEEELWRREAARVRRSTPGLVKGHLDLHLRIAADLEIDTSSLSPSDAAIQILAIASRPGAARALAAVR